MIKWFEEESVLARGDMLANHRPSLALAQWQQVRILQQYNPAQTKNSCSSGVVRNKTAKK